MLHFLGKSCFPVCHESQCKKKKTRKKKKMSVHSNGAFCSDMAIFGILLCARLEEVAAFKAQMCKCPHLHSSSAKIVFPAYCSQYTHTKEKREIKKP